MIVAPTADLELATRAVLFSAAGTCGQRCTSLRRLIAHESVRDEITARVAKAYGQIRIGDPREAATLVGPLIDAGGFEMMQSAINRAKTEGGDVIGGERVALKGLDNGFYVKPSIVKMPKQTSVVKDETFAPILYVMGYKDLDEAIHVQNDVPQGLSSCIFTNDLREAERFVSADGSDCGIANVNVGPSGAEIGGAFGGEKETGGGRESGLGLVAQLHAPRDEHRELLEGFAARAGDRLRLMRAGHLASAVAMATALAVGLASCSSSDSDSPAKADAGNATEGGVLGEADPTSSSTPERGKRRSRCRSRIRARSRITCR